MEEKITAPNIIWSFFTGFFIIPLFIMVINRIDNSNLLFIPTFIIGFIVPIFFACMNIKYIRKEVRKGRSLWRFGRTIKPGDFSNLYVPAWKRMAIIFGCTIFSIFLIMII